MCMKLKIWRVLNGHVRHLYNVFNLVLFGFWVTNAFDFLVAIYIERAADDEMCIYCLRVNNYFSFLFFSYFFTINFTNGVLKKSLELFLHDKIWKAFHSLVKYAFK